jgi:hypothetical protein
MKVDILKNFNMLPLMIKNMKQRFYIKLVKIIYMFYLVNKYKKTILIRWYFKAKLNIKLIDCHSVRKKTIEKYFLIIKIFIY